MDKKELSPTKKKVIAILSASAMCLTAGLISFIDPESKGRDFWKILLTTLPILIGLFIAIIIYKKSKVIKIIVFVVGLVLMLPILWFVNLVDFVNLAGLYIGAFLVGLQWSKSSFIKEMLEKEKVDKNLK